MRILSGICRQCDAPFQRPNSGGKDRVLFCGKSCSAKYNNSRRPPRATALRPCETCPSCGGRRSDSTKNSLCRACRKAERLAVLQALTLGELRAAHNTLAYHAKIRGLARSAYQGALACRVCGYDRHVDVCHVQPVARFPKTASIAEVNAPTNLIALCPTHHWEFDNGHLNDFLATLTTA